MPLMDSFADLRTDLLDRAGEDPTDATGDYYATAGRQLVRAQHEIQNRHPFLFLRANPPGVLRTLAPITAGTVAVTVNATAINFSSPPAPSVAGWKFRVTGDQEWYRIATHIAGAAAATLDTAYDGTTAVAASYTVYQDEYDLASDVRHLVGMYVAEDGSRIDQKPEDWIRQHFPGPASAVWPPQAFARIGEQRILFNGYPDRTRRIEYAYTIISSDLDGAGVTILIPRNWRYVITDGGLFWTYVTKSDSRADSAGVVFAGSLEALIADDLRKRMELVGASVEPGPYS